MHVAGHADNDPEAAVAHRFWLPNDTWSSITQFLPRADILRLRTTDSETRRQVDDAIQSLRLRPESLIRFLDSDSFKNIRHLDASRLDEAALHRLTTHLAAHPRPEMTIRLDPSFGSVDVATLLDLSALSLKGLVLSLRSTSVEHLHALAACRYPIDLTLRYLTHATFDAASNLPTLQRFVAEASDITEDGAVRFASHGALETLDIRMSHATPSSALQRLASIPTLREFRLNGLSGPDLDTPTARALAANPRLENLTILSNGAGLDEDGFAALSRSQSLRTLQVPLRAAMHELANMKCVRNLILAGRNLGPDPILDAATARSIAALPALESITLPSMNREPDTLTAILKDSIARELTFCSSRWDGYIFYPQEKAVFMANTRLKSLNFFNTNIHQPTRDLLFNHPTIDHVRMGDSEFTRPPGSNATLTRRGG